MRNGGFDAAFSEEAVVPDGGGGFLGDGATGGVVDVPVVTA